MAVHIQNLCIELLTSKWYSPILHYRDHSWSTVSELYIELFVILWFCPPPKDKFIQFWRSHTTGERPLRTDWHQLTYWDSWKKNTYQATCCLMIITGLSCLVVGQSKYPHHWPTTSQPICLVKLSWSVSSVRTWTISMPWRPGQLMQGA